jgi:hypothetical protein
MNRRILMVVGSLIALNTASIAQADELKFRIVSHVSSVQIANVGDVEGHALSVGRQEGLAFLQDGSVGAAILTATTDYTKGAGTFLAYWNLTLNDGSTLYWKWNGLAKVEGTSTISPESPVTIISGTGQFEGAKGDGTQKGVRVAACGRRASLCRCRS